MGTLFSMVSSRGSRANVKQKTAHRFHAELAALERSEETPASTVSLAMWSKVEICVSVLSCFENARSDR